MDADRATASVLALMRAVAAAYGDQAWSTEVPGALAVTTGLPLASMNGVWVIGACSMDDVALLLTDVSARAESYCLQARPAYRSSVQQLAEHRGMTLDEDVPLMVVDEAGLHRPAATTPTDLITLAADELDRHTGVAAAGFEAPIEIFESLVATTTGLPGFRAYLAQADGVDVSTAVTIPTLDSVGVLSVATPPEHRQRGHGALVTGYATECGLSAGASFAWLQSSEAGFRVYEKLGFVTVESWPMWVNASP